MFMVCARKNRKLLSAFSADISLSFAHNLLCELGNWMVFSFHVYITTTTPSPLYSAWKITKKRKYFPQTRRRRLLLRVRVIFPCSKSTNCSRINFCVNSHNNRVRVVFLDGINATWLIFLQKYKVTWHTALTFAFQFCEWGVFRENK